MEAGVVHLDAHIVVWLYSGLLDLIPTQISQLINENSIRILPIVVLEIQFLYETKQITVPSDTILEDLDLRIGLRLDRLSFARVARQELLRNGIVILLIA